MSSNSLLITERNLKINVKKSLDLLLKNDIYLLRNNINERTISHKLAEYLQQIFPEWNVDCEYNRNHGKIKIVRLPPQECKTNDLEARTVFPDIIIHHRNTDDNLLVIEMKKSTNTQGIEFDRTKLNAYKTELHYKYTLFIMFNIRNIENITYCCDW